jgi:hypothetical protein
MPSTAMPMSTASRLSRYKVTARIGTPRRLKPGDWPLVRRADNPTGTDPAQAGNLGPISVQTGQFGPPHRPG